MPQEYAIECTCSHRSERFQLAFARRALEIMPLDECTKFEPRKDGLKVLAETELALERPITRLREIYGDAVRIQPPAVRYQNSEEPHMGLRIVCSPDGFEALRRDLRERRALILDAEARKQLAIIRATAPLSRLMGYSARVSALTAGRGRLVMWLSHYARLDAPPPGAA